MFNPVWFPRGDASNLERGRTGIKQGVVTQYVLFYGAESRVLPRTSSHLWPASEVCPSLCHTSTSDPWERTPNETTICPFSLGLCPVSPEFHLSVYSVPVRAGFCLSAKTMRSRGGAPLHWAFHRPVAPSSSWCLDTPCPLLEGLLVQNSGPKMRSGFVKENIFGKYDLRF